MNNKLQDMVFITDAGDSELEEEVLIDKKEFLEINKSKGEGKKMQNPEKQNLLLLIHFSWELHKHL